MPAVSGITVERIELRRITMPLVRPFRTSYATQRERDVLLITIHAGRNVGWGECVAMPWPYYTSEWIDGAHQIVRDELVPRLLEASTVGPDDLEHLFSPVRGHHMAKAAVEMAVLDASLRASGVSLAAFLGASRAAVPAGVSIGISSSPEELYAQIEEYLRDGYRRVKLKIAPGADVDVVAAVRARFGAELVLQVDANGAYTLDDAVHLAQLDAFELAMIEQPLDADDLLGHAELARRIRTPICLDEAIDSVRAAEVAFSIGAVGVINCKPARLGGLLAARRLHDLCLRRGVSLWCGGMLETGIGRAANVALAALDGFALPGDLSASSRYWHRDLITAPFVLRDGGLDVPTTPGLGVEIDFDYVESVTRLRESFERL